MTLGIRHAGEVALITIIRLDQRVGIFPSHPGGSNPFDSGDGFMWLYIVGLVYVLVACVYAYMFPTKGK